MKLRCENLVKKYGPRTVVKGVSMEVNQGEIVGFLGPNGAGKSTTMNILTGYLSATSGSVKIAGYDILENPMEAKKLKRKFTLFLVFYSIFYVRDGIWGSEGIWAEKDPVFIKNVKKF